MSQWGAPRMFGTCEFVPHVESRPFTPIHSEQTIGLVVLINVYGDSAPR
jgi:hypothetical protein